ncbi:MAG: tRNA (N6-isopentenyl adenosine(37)-C2)-methylthiotransferase MiaB [Planctomycetes bacterium]|nr:tRNA (N6-isopentenyl adenosine(37)-C2)-methylthiotransferase MiaB [Planctomycetota bacterium]
MKPPYMMALERRTEVPREKRVFFEVFGCQMNKLDSELMLESLTSSGYALTHDVDEAGVIVYNTCSIREKAEERAYSRLGSFKKRKARDPNLVIALTGCVAQHHQSDLLAKLPHVDMIVGTREFHRLPSMIEAARQGAEPTVATELDSPLEFHRSRNLGPSRTQAYVSVMRGCDQVCSYCIVPTTRGKEVSRPPEVILDEIRRLAADGVREITFLGQTVNSYGKRLGDGIGLHTLLYGVEEIGGIERVRFITSHPRYMRPKLIDAMASCEKACEYLHLPVQSGSSAVLARMKRTYDRDFFLKVVDRLRSSIANFSLATDFIVGFPGETDDEFEESMSLAREVGFDHGYVFKYSPRPGTVSHRMVDDVPDDVKKERNNLLLAEVLRTAQIRNESWVGRTVEILTEGPSKNDPSRFTGRTRDHRIVSFAADACEPSGMFQRVRVDRATGTSLWGTKVDAPTASPRDPKPRFGSDA